MRGLSLAVALIVGLLAACIGQRAAQAEDGIFNLSEVDCLTLNMYWEARGTGETGLRAVAHVTINRVKSSLFPNSICAVVAQGGQNASGGACQFSWWCDGLDDWPYDMRMWRAAHTIARRVMLGSDSDPTGNALWYHADYVEPYWASSYEQTVQIGTHIFYR
jgi:spore germination cell wall hydrolase CwlJ-like protein